MKKFFIFFILTLYLFFACGAQAVTAKPGDTVTIPVSVSNTDAHVILLIFDYDENILEFVSNECWGPNTQYSKYRMLMFDAINLLPSGQMGTITFRVKEDAPFGTYTIPYSYEAVNTYYEFTTIGVSIGSIEVECPHSRTWDDVAREADYENEGLIYVTCAKCGEVVETKTIEKLVHTPSFLELLIMYLFGAK